MSNLLPNIDTIVVTNLFDACRNFESQLRYVTSVDCFRHRNSSGVT